MVAMLSTGQMNRPMAWIQGSAMKVHHAAIDTLDEPPFFTRHMLHDKSLKEHTAKVPALMTLAFCNMHAL